MDYIIFDLEWNNDFDHAVKKYQNHIIEIGAIRLDYRMRVTDTFAQLVKPENFSSLSGRCKEITNITDEEIKEQGIDFARAIGDFERWAKSDDALFLSWSDSDLSVLSSDWLAAFKNSKIDFIKKYCDAQLYCMDCMGLGRGNQISLSNCAEQLGIDIDTSKLHRALADCYVTFYCFEKLFDNDKLSEHIHICSSEFFERTAFKPFYIREPKCGGFDIDKVEILCPACSSPMKPVGGATLVGASFKRAVFCKQCNRYFWSFVKAKKRYDDVKLYITVNRMNKKRAAKYRKKAKNQK